MPETPDFDQLARELLIALHGQEADQFPELIVDKLRLIWNARGAADIAKIDTELSAMMGGTAAGPYCKNLDRALRKLDR